MDTTKIDALKTEIETAANAAPTAAAVAKSAALVTAAQHEAEKVVARVDQLLKTIERSDAALTATDASFAAAVQPVTAALGTSLSATAFGDLRGLLAADATHPIPSTAWAAVQTAVSGDDADTAAVLTAPAAALAVAKAAADDARVEVDEALANFLAADQAIQSVAGRAREAQAALGAQVAAIGADLDAGNALGAARQLVDAERARAALETLLTRNAERVARTDKRARLETALGAWAEAETARLVKTEAYATASAAHARRLVERSIRLAAAIDTARDVSSP